MRILIISSMLRRLVPLPVLQKAILKMGKIFLLEQVRHKSFHRDRLLLLLHLKMRVLIVNLVHRQTVNLFVFLLTRRAISYIKREHRCLIKLSAAKINGWLTIMNINLSGVSAAMAVYSIFPWIRLKHL